MIFRAHHPSARNLSQRRASCAQPLRTKSVRMMFVVRTTSVHDICLNDAFRITPIQGRTVLARPLVF
jgi:hypothetical protein